MPTLRRVGNDRSISAGGYRFLVTSNCLFQESILVLFPFRSQQIAARSITRRFIRLYFPSLPENLPTIASGFVNINCVWTGFFKTYSLLSKPKVPQEVFPPPSQVANIDIATLKTAGLSTRKAEYDVTFRVAFEAAFSMFCNGSPRPGIPFCGRTFIESEAGWSGRRRACETINWSSRHWKGVHQFIDHWWFQIFISFPLLRQTVFSGMVRECQKQGDQLLSKWKQWTC